jgi:nicotinamide mononucleotide transporter
MSVFAWLSVNYIEVFGAVTGIVYVFLEIRQTLWLWPVGIATSAVYIWIFFTGKLYADMSLQVYYLVISCIGWYWWVRGIGKKPENEKNTRTESDKLREGEPECEKKTGKDCLSVTRLSYRLGIILFVAFIVLYLIMWLVLSHLTDSPVPQWDSLLTSLSVVATWMLARKIYEHWFIWIAVNFIAAILFLSRGLYPTVVLYLVYGIMSFFGLSAWKKILN